MRVFGHGNHEGDQAGRYEGGGVVWGSCGGRVGVEIGRKMGDFIGLGGG